MFDDNFTDKKDYIGIYECDFSYVYNQPKHALQNIWIAMVNPESQDFTKVRGYLRMSMSVLHEADPTVIKLFNL